MYQHPIFIEGEFAHRQTFYPKFKLEKKVKPAQEQVKLNCISIQKEVCCA